MATISKIKIENNEYEIKDSTARNDIETTKETMQSNDNKLSKSITGLNNELIVERQRISNLSNLEEGSTTGDAELQDIRVAYNGKTYETAGESVRGQINDIINSIGNHIYETDQHHGDSGMFKEFVTPILTGTKMYFKPINNLLGEAISFYVYGFKEDGTYDILVNGSAINGVIPEKLYSIEALNEYTKIRVYYNGTFTFESIGRFIFGFVGDGSLFDYLSQNINVFDLKSLSTFDSNYTITDNSYEKYGVTDLNELELMKVYYFYNATKILNTPVNNLYGVVYTINYTSEYMSGCVQYYIDKTNIIYFRSSYGTRDDIYWSDWKKVVSNDELEQLKSTINNSITRLETHNKETYKIFKRICCVGDSYTSGNITDSNGVMHSTNEEFAWPHYMATASGNEYINCGVSGANANTWLTAERGLAKAQQTGKVQAYIIGLAINDTSNSDRHLDLGIESDIGTENVTYYGRYSKIIRELHNISPNAKIFVQTCPDNDTNRYNPYNNAIKTIANQYAEEYNVHVLDLANYKELYNESSLVADKLAGHYTAAGYEQFAEILQHVMSDYINSHIDEFQDVAFIEYE